MDGPNHKAVESFMQGLPAPDGWEYILVIYKVDPNLARSRITVIGNGDPAAVKIIMTNLSEAMDGREAEEGEPRGDDTIQ